MITIDEKLLSEETLKMIYIDLYGKTNLNNFIKKALVDHSKDSGIFNYMTDLNTNEAEELMHLAVDVYNSKKERDRTYEWKLVE